MFLPILPYIIRSLKASCSYGHIQLIAIQPIQPPVNLLSHSKIVMYNWKCFQSIGWRPHFDEQLATKIVLPVLPKFPFICDINPLEI